MTTISCSACRTELDGDDEAYELEDASTVLCQLCFGLNNLVTEFGYEEVCGALTRLGKGSTAMNCADCNHPTHDAGECRQCNCGLAEICHPSGRSEPEITYVHEGGLRTLIDCGHRVKPHKRAEDLDR